MKLVIGGRQGSALGASALLALALVLAGCGGKTHPAGAPPAGNPSAGSTAPGPGAGPTGSGGSALPYGLTAGTAHVVVTGSAPQTFDLTELSPAQGQIVGAEQGPGYNFYASEANGVVLRFPPQGEVGTVLTSGSLLTPIDVEVDLGNTSHQRFSSGDVPGSCTATLTRVSATALGGTVSCTGLKDSSTQSSADVTATFSLST